MIPLSILAISMKLTLLVVCYDLKMLGMILIYLLENMNFTVLSTCVAQLVGAPNFASKFSVYKDCSEEVRFIFGGISS